MAERGGRGAAARVGAVILAADDAFLVSQARQGDLRAFELLAQRYSRFAYRVALRIVGNHHDAQDVAQEALISGWRNLAGYRFEAAFSTWLYQIVSRRALSHLASGPRQSGGQEPPQDLPDRASDPAEIVARQETVGAVTAAIVALPGPQRAAIVLHHLEGFSYAEVAAMTTSSVPAVRSHIFRGRRTLTAARDRWK